MSMDLVVSVRLSDVTAKALRRFAASENKKISVVCRDIITHYFEEFDGKNQWQKEIEYKLSDLQERLEKLEKPPKTEKPKSNSEKPKEPIRDKITEELGL